MSGTIMHAIHCMGCGSEGDRSKASTSKSAPPPKPSLLLLLLLLRE
jgi:hypothetical protein